MRPLLWSVLAAVVVTGCTRGRFGRAPVAPQADPSAAPAGQEAADVKPAGANSPVTKPIFPQAGAGRPHGATPEEYLVLVYVNFDILQARVPKGAFSESGKIWNHLDEEAIPADLAALLQKNGLRVGRGSPDSWPPIKALLDQETGVETSRSNTTVGNGLPLSLNVDQHRMRDQTLFLFRRDGTLGGVTFPKSSSFLRLEYDLSTAAPEGVTLEVMPEFREQQVLGKLTLRDAVLDQPIEQPTRVLRELAFRMHIKADQFCAVGPSSAAHQGHLAGSLLLSEEVEGRRHESIYFITPHVYRTDRLEPP